jgi:hypothetical protein
VIIPFSVKFIHQFTAVIAPVKILVPGGVGVLMQGDRGVGGKLKVHAPSLQITGQDALTQQFLMMRMNACNSTQYLWSNG